MLMRISGESRNPGHAAIAHVQKLLPFARGLHAKHKFAIACNSVEITVTWRLLRERQKKKKRERRRYCKREKCTAGSRH